MATRAAATRCLPTLLSFGGRFRSSEGQSIRALSQAAEAQTKQSMVATRPLPTLLHLGGRFRSSEEQSIRALSQAVEVPRGTRIYGAPLKQRQNILRHHGIEFQHLPSDFAERSVSKVWESKCSTSLQHLTANLSLKTKPKPDVILDHIDVDDCGYFTVYSLEEDGTLLRKYDIYPPAAVDDGNFVCGCNGLLLFENEDKELILWNPTTNEFKILPQPCDEVPLVDRHYIAFEMKSDHGSEDYKVLVMVMVVEDDEKGNHIRISHEIALYSLRSNSWKIIPFTRYRGYEVSGVCLNGCYYCLAYVDKIQVVMSFDFATETLSSLPLPNVSKSDSYRVVKYKGRLGVVVVPLYEAERSYGLWVMNDGSWSKETVFHTSGVWQLECFSDNGELLYFQNFRQEFAVFDRATGKSKTLGFYGINGCIQLIPFYESFVQLKEENKRGEKFIF